MRNEDSRCDPKRSLSSSPNDPTRSPCHDQLTPEDVPTLLYPVTCIEDRLIPMRPSKPENLASLLNLISCPEDVSTLPRDLDTGVKDGHPPMYHCSDSLDHRDTYVARRTGSEVPYPTSPSVLKQRFVEWPDVGSILPGEMELDPSVQRRGLGVSPSDQAEDTCDGDLIYGIWDSFSEKQIIISHSFLSI